MEEQAELTVNSTIVLAMIAGALLSVRAHEVSANPASMPYAGQVADLEPGAPEYA